MILINLQVYTTFDMDIIKNETKRSKTKTIVMAAMASIAMLLTTSAMSSSVGILPQEAFAKKGGGGHTFCITFTEDGDKGTACFTGPGAHKDCNQFTKEVGGTKCKILK